MIRPFLSAADCLPPCVSTARFAAKQMLYRVGIAFVSILQYIPRLIFKDLYGMFIVVGSSFFAAPCSATLGSFFFGMPRPVKPHRI